MRDSWADLQRKQKKAVHSAFSRFAVYDFGAFSTTCSVRYHVETPLFADLDREGYAKVAEDIITLVLSPDEIPEPSRGAIVTIDSMENSYQIERVRPRENPYEVVCEVRKVRKP